MSVFANLRPVAVHPALVNASPLKPEILRGVDLIFVRELTGGLYFGQPKGRTIVNGSQRVVDTLEYYDFEIERVVDLAFRLAQSRRKKLTLVDKANVLESSRLWRQIAAQVAARYPDVTLDTLLAGSMGMLPSASLGERGPGLFEPIHGSAPDIAGKGIANPLGTILSTAMLLRYSLKLEKEAAVIEAAVNKAITDGCRTTDLGGSLGTKEMTNAVLESM